MTTEHVVSAESAIWGLFCARRAPMQLIHILLTYMIKFSPSGITRNKGRQLLLICEIQSWNTRMAFNKEIKIVPIYVQSDLWSDVRSTFLGDGSWNFVVDMLCGDYAPENRLNSLKSLGHWPRSQDSEPGRPGDLNEINANFFWERV